jgi:hypothetical protein
VAIAKHTIKTKITVNQFPMDPGIPAQLRLVLARVSGGVEMMKRLARINQTIQLTAGADTKLLQRALGRKCKPGAKGAACQLEQLLSLFVARQAYQLSQRSVPFIAQALQHSASRPISALARAELLRRV